MKDPGQDLLWGSCPYLHKESPLLNFQGNQVSLALPGREQDFSASPGGCISLGCPSLLPVSCRFLRMEQKHLLNQDSITRA